MPALVRLNPAECALLLVDFQEKLVPSVDPERLAVARADLLAQGARKLGVPVLATEQYPKGLGKTVEVLRQHLAHAPWEKTRFSAAIDPVVGWLRQDARRTIVLAGMEAHICLAQTALDLIEADFAVAIAVDAIAGWGHVDRETGLGRMTGAGAIPVTVEAVLFEWMGDASHPVFKEISALVRQSRAALENV